MHGVERPPLFPESPVATLLPSRLTPFAQHQRSLQSLRRTAPEITHSSFLLVSLPSETTASQALLSYLPLPANSQLPQP